MLTVTRAEGGKILKAIVTVINDYGEVINKDEIIMPHEEYITNDLKSMTSTKTTVFMFAVKEQLNQEQKFFSFYKERKTWI